MTFMASCLRVSAQVFMSEAEALKVIAPQAVWTEEIKSLGDAARQSLSKVTRLHFAEPEYHFHVAREGERATAYARTLEEIGKSEPITFTVGLDAEGKITEVILLLYRESRGAEVRDPRFLKQFRGKTRRDPVQIDREILNYAGATLSSQALARGVRKALALFEQFYGANSKTTAGAVVSSGPRIPNLNSDGRTENSARPTPSVMGGISSRYTQARYLMGTVCVIEVDSPDRVPGERAVNAAFEAMQEVDRRMSNYRADSELSMLNQRAAQSPVRVSQEMFEVLSLAQSVSEASDSAFDVTVAPLLRAWEFLPKTGGKAPHTAPLVVGYRLMQLSPGDQTVRFERPGLEIDLGGIAKGYAVDRAVAALRAAGITSARVSAGGSTIYGLGAPPEEPRGWPLTLPSGEIIHLRDMAASNSGHSEKFVEVGGHRYSHIFDPRRGEPVSTATATVTVQSASAMESDAYTKPYFILNELDQDGLRQAFPHTRVWITRSRNQTYAAAR